MTTYHDLLKHVISPLLLWCIKMTTFKYSYNNEVFEVDSFLVPEDSLLSVIYNRSKTEIANSTDPNLPYVIDYITNRPIIGDESIITVLDYWGVYRTYDVIYADEKYMRENMYNPGFEGHEMNTNQYYRLRSLNAFTDEYQIFQETYTKPEGLLYASTKFSTIPLLIQQIYKQDNPLYDPPHVKHIPSHETTIKRLQSLDFLFDSARNNDINVIIAGKHIFKMLMGEDMVSSEYPTQLNPWTFHTEHTEIDVFILGSDLQNIADYIDEIGREIELIYDGYNKLLYSVSVTCTRTSRSVSIIVNVNNKQVLKLNIILKIYKTYSEVLHGFDVDCDCVGWDGTNILATERGSYSLFRDYNTVNTDFISSSYEFNLYKYTRIGMSVDISNATNSFIQRLKYTLRPGFYMNTRIKGARPYALDVGGIFSTGEHPEILAQLEEIMRNDGWDEDTIARLTYQRDQLPGVFKIKTYDVMSSITLILTDLNGGSVVGLLTINPTVYKMMQATSDVRITEGTTLAITTPGQEITNTFD